jgi:hypothetical protein
MGSDDEWGHDPSVQVMRRLFKHMEVAQGELLEASNISPFDARLRRWREKALESFEKAWAYAAKSDFELKEDRAAALYSRFPFTLRITLSRLRWSR